MLRDFAHEMEPVSPSLELLPTCPTCGGVHVTPMGNGDYSCDACGTHIDAFTWERKTEELIA